MDETLEGRSLRTARALPPLPRRVALVFSSPGRLFLALRDEPSVMGALLLGAVLVSLSNLLLPSAIWEEGIRLQLAEAGQSLPMELETVARMAKVAASIGALVAWPILGAIASGVFSLVFLFVLGYEGTYRQYLAVTSHALLVAAVAALVLVPFRIVTGDPRFALTVGTFLPFLEGGLVGRLTQLSDLFNLWVYALVGLGASILDGTRRAGSSVAAALAVAFLVSLLFAALTG